MILLLAEKSHVTVRSFSKIAPKSNVHGKTSSTLKTGRSNRGKAPLLERPVFNAHVKTSLTLKKRKL